MSEPYHYLTHPNTHQVVSVYSTEGQHLLKQYLRSYLRATRTIEQSGGFLFESDLRVHELKSGALKISHHQLDFWTASTGLKDIIMPKLVQNSRNITGLKDFILVVKPTPTACNPS